MKFAIIGSGAVGGYFGARLHEAGHTVYFLARGSHLEALRKNGLQIKSVAGDYKALNVESHELALRSTILAVLSEFAEEDIQGTNGKAALASALKEGINNKLILLENFGGIEEVLFTSFVLN